MGVYLNCLIVFLNRYSSLSLTPFTSLGVFHQIGKACSYCGGGAPKPKGRGADSRSSTSLHPCSDAVNRMEPGPTCPSLRCFCQVCGWFLLLVFFPKEAAVKGRASSAHLPACRNARVVLDLYCGSCLPGPSLQVQR